MNNKNSTPLEVGDAIREGYLRYFDTAFWLRDKTLMAERRKLLESDGTVFADTLIEPLLPYAPTDPIKDVLQGQGFDSQIADQLAYMFFGPGNDGGFRLRKHQARALESSLSTDPSGRQNIVVTAGTGSGKTECFLLPVLARLLRERASWGSPTSLYRWWDRALEPERWRNSRSDCNRPAAVRSIILYPTNALVEDQISRLRRALMAVSIVGAPQIFFGRYTGATPGKGEVPDGRSSTERVRRESELLRSLEKDRDSISSNDADLIAQFQDPRSSEMINRWDMIEAPPDILITNYSMLNVMLMRAREDRIFDLTKSWLQSDRRNCFTLVVDEMHTYRGTQGTEVSLMVRSLLRRLGLSSDSDQIRCIATSASLSPESGRKYVQDFFGIDGNKFEIIPDDPIALPKSKPLSRSTFLDISIDDDPASRLTKIETITQQVSLPIALANACKKNSTYAPTTLTDIDQRLFDEDGTADDGALGAVLSSIATTQTDKDIRYRAHLFARMIRGMWACSNPNCTECNDRQDSNSRIGKLFSNPAVACKCGGRVLACIIQCAVQRCHHSVGEIPTRQGSFQPVAIGTIVEVTKQLKLSM